jgi:hypothetical protein
LAHLARPLLSIWSNSVTRDSAIRILSLASGFWQQAENLSVDSLS